ncbi:MAG: hypothetical protein U0166_08800 [Acidobacteriota bacterium]
MSFRRTLPLAALAIVAAAFARTGVPKPDVISLPDGDAGIGFDDLQYAASVPAILAPGGRTGFLVLIDPRTKALSPVEGFSSEAKFSGGHGQGTTSAVEGDGLVFASDRGSKVIKAVDPKAKKIVSSAPLSGTPDYVRFVARRHEIWVTEPGKKQVEILRVDPDTHAMQGVGKVAFPDGPESLVIDGERGRAYTHSWQGETYAVDVEARKVVATWKNGCEGSRGAAIDIERGMLFVGCAEGRQAVIDVTSGRLIGSAQAGSDVDSIAYNPVLRHLYVPGGGSADLSILAVSGDGDLSLLGKVPTGPDAHTAAIDPATNDVYVGSPEHGQVLVLRDPFPASAR